MNCNTHSYEQQFNAQFELISANTPELITACKKLRYQVYCEERKFFDRSNFIEEDSYDNHAIQTLLLDKTSGEYIATVRLILSHNNDRDFSYPLEEHVVKQNHNAIEMINDLPKNNTAEVSRFSISKRLRRHNKSAENLGRNGKSTNNSAEYYSLVTVGLIKAIIKISAENDVTNWLALMKPSFLRLLSRIGINFITHDNYIDYYGKRYACMNSVADILAGIRETKPDAWRLITDNGKITIH